MNNKYVLISIAIMSIVTIILRFLPFIVLDDSKDYKLLNYLNKVMPSAVMGMLVVYCIRDIEFTSINGYLPTLIAGSITAFTYIWKRKTLFSIISGTVVYMFLIQMIF